MKLFFSFLFTVALFLTPLIGRTNSRVCIDRFDPHANSFNFTIRPTQVDCKVNERTMDVKKTSSGIRIFYEIEQANQQSFDKFAPNQKE